MSENFNIPALPEQYRKYFWDVKFSELTLTLHKQFILARLLNHGTFDTFEWIFSTFTQNDILVFINDKGKDSLTRNSYLFWEKLAKDESFWKKG